MVGSDFVVKKTNLNVLELTKIIAVNFFFYVFLISKIASFLVLSK